jgi:hypothetical protein
MEILWPALGICVLVAFVFYVLAKRWQQILQHQTRMIRRLGERLQAVEEVDDPVFRRRLYETSPVPLERVFTLSFHLGERFWRDVLQVSMETLHFLQESSAFVGSIKLEAWRSHTVATITEVLPQGKGAHWQTRSLDFYPEASGTDEGIVLWELPLAPPCPAIERPPYLELRLHRNFIELRGRLLPAIEDESGNRHRASYTKTDDLLFLHIPLDPNLLAEFQTRDPAEETSVEEKRFRADGFPPIAQSWHAFYENRDENTGTDWQLRLHDLRLKSDWERDKILDTRTIYVPREK